MTRSLKRGLVICERAKFHDAFSETKPPSVRCVWLWLVINPLGLRHRAGSLRLTRRLLQQPLSPLCGFIVSYYFKQFKSMSKAAQVRFDFPLTGFCYYQPNFRSAIRHARIQPLGFKFRCIKKDDSGVDPIRNLFCPQDCKKQPTPGAFAGLTASSLRPVPMLISSTPGSHPCSKKKRRSNRRIFESFFRTETGIFFQNHKTKSLVSVANTFAFRKLKNFP